MKRFLLLLLCTVALSGCSKTKMTDTYLGSVPGDGNIELEFYKNGDVLATHKQTGVSDWGIYRIEDGVSGIETKAVYLYIKYVTLYAGNNIFSFDDEPAMVSRYAKDRNSFTIKITKYHSGWSSDYSITFRRIK